MRDQQDNRRDFLRNSLYSAAGLAMFPQLTPNAYGSVKTVVAGGPTATVMPPRIKFAVIGMNHGHIYGQVEAVTRGGGELVSFFAKEADLTAAFAKRYPNAKQAKSEAEILEDKSIQLVLSSAIPDERGPLGVRVMKAGKDYMVDKPGLTTLEQLAEVRKVQKETKRIYSIMYSERLENRATVKAGELIKEGIIGKVVQTIGLGPHRMNANTRPEWFFDKKRFGGIICDIASHQFDQFLFFTNSTKAQVIASQVGNVNHPQYPKFEDFGDAMLRGNGGAGYIRVDWFTPDGLKTWGDGRLTVLGTEGYIEIRKNIDIGGREGGNHLFVVNNKETMYVDCTKVELPYGRQLVDDVLNRTETAMSQEHCFLATELCLKAQKNAQNVSVVS
ncbi:Gfo/Idh/MocA family protein [Dyadobacter fermentans]|uniref:Oxidoreductase domain protein n=1 Tax=Dyadobacter fermentans (strain ATCC 700827 / DSM 18053 / CIP 107007 / KCTC 52180 / NS114) TaxID=471854 RepID=C6VX65_DYAFD|nr:Gfo/Idh/MocA family oxidoreductase [Dyadobacter fermentans]ACT91538.1 oxidoreductase domain protein [Dyadobacter fermentans DSM 18053]